LGPWEAEAHLHYDPEVEEVLGRVGLLGRRAAADQGSGVALSVEAGFFAALHLGTTVRQRRLKMS